MYPPRQCAGASGGDAGLYFFALILAGAFTLLPGRRMHDVLFGASAGWTPSLIAGLALTASRRSICSSGASRRDLPGGEVSALLAA